MALSFQAAAFGMVGLTAVTLALIGPPGSHKEPAQEDPFSQTAAAPAPETPAPKPIATVAAAGLTLKSVDVSLPMSDRTFPDGPHADVINNNCVACHSAGMVLTQPSLKRAEWQAEVNKMRNTYKAPVSDADAAAIVDYLASTKGL